MAPFLKCVVDHLKMRLASRQAWCKIGEQAIAYNVNPDGCF